MNKYKRIDTTAVFVFDNNDVDFLGKNFNRLKWFDLSIVGIETNGKSFVIDYLSFKSADHLYNGIANLVIFHNMNFCNNISSYLNICEFIQRQNSSIIIGLDNIVKYIDFISFRIG